MELDELIPPEALRKPGDGEDSNQRERIAVCVELAMRNLQHGRVRAEGEQSETVHCFGSGDDTLYALEDGGGRLMMGRGVGRDGEGCIYCLVGTSSVGLLLLLDDGEMIPAEAFEGATELTLCSVYQDDQVHNVVLVQHYKALEDVPAQYRPAQPFLQFTEQ